MKNIAWLPLLLVLCGVTCQALAIKDEVPAAAGAVASPYQYPPPRDEPNVLLSWSLIFQAAVLALCAKTFWTTRALEIMHARMEERLVRMDEADNRIRAEVDRLLTCRNYRPDPPDA